MSTLGKCPHCGSPVSSYGPEMYECGTCPANAHPLGCYDRNDNTLVLSGVCEERASHAETRTRLGQAEKLNRIALNALRCALNLIHDPYSERVIKDAIDSLTDAEKGGAK